MGKILNGLRLPTLILGVLLLFIADRYLGAAPSHLVLRTLALALAAISIIMTLALAGGARAAGHHEEARGWQYLSYWQLAILVSLGTYLWYAKVIGDATGPDTPFAKALLAIWLLLFVLGLAAGIGGEWARLGAGQGANAEAGRVLRSSMSWLSIGLLLGFLAAINYTGDKKDIQRDWSYLKVRSPSGSTRNMLKTLTGELKVALFFPQDNEVRSVVEDYFTALAAADKHVKLEWYDKDMAPTVAEEYRVSRNGQVVLDMKGKKSRIDTGTTLAKAKKTLKELDSEFQKAFLETTAERKTLYFTRGHGEYSWVGESGDNPLRSLHLLEGFLKQQNYSTRLFGVAEGSGSAVPEDASAVVIVGPTEAFLKEEIDALKAYLDRGGNLMVFMGLEKSTGQTLAPQPATPGAPGDGQPLQQMLEGMGLKFTAVPLGNEKNYYPATHSAADVWFIYSNVFTSHDSVVSLARHDERVALLMYRAGYFTVTPELGKWKAFETVRTLPDTFADANLNYKYDIGERKDAFVVGAVAELKKPDAKAADSSKKNERQGRVVAFANATSIADAMVRNIGNALYFSDSLKWMVGDSQMQGELASEEDVKIRHTRNEDVVWFQSTVVLVPLLVLGAGFLATRRRKGGGREDSDKDKVKTDAA